MDYLSLALKLSRQFTRQDVSFSVDISKLIRRVEHQHTTFVEL